jgi:hypothetical protein
LNDLSLASPLVEEELKELLVDSDLSEAWTTDILSNPVAYEAPQSAVMISLDDVGAKRQKESREQAAHAPPGKKKGCDRSLPTPLCRQWRLLSGVGRVDTNERKRF